ncbi:MAG: hypothetical protein ACLQVM_30590 [Terriglobia bacterium]
MKSKDAFRVACLLMYAAWQVACGTTAGDVNQSPPPNVTITISPASVNMLMGKTQQFTATVSDGSAVTWSVNGVTGGNAAVGTISGNGLYAAPASVPNPNPVTVAAVSVENSADSASATVAIGAVNSVTITPTSAAMATTQKPLAFTHNLQCSGMCDTGVDWSVNGVPGGNAAVGMIDLLGNYTPPATVNGPFTATVTVASVEAPGESASATVMVIFNWVQYYAPGGLNDSATAMALSSDGTELVVADARDIPSFPQNPTDPYYTDKTVGLLLFNTQTGELLDSTWTDSPTPSKIVSMVTDPSTGNIYAAGYEYNDASRTAAVWKITASNPLQVEKLAEFQLGGVRTEVRVIQLYGGSIYLAVNGDYETCPSFCSSGDFIVPLGASGNKQPEMPLYTYSYKTSVTGMFVSSQWIFVTGNVFDENGNLQGWYEGHYDFTGTVQPPFGKSFVGPPTEFGTGIFQNTVGEVLLTGTITYSNTEQFLWVSGSDAQLDDPNLFGQWNGGNSGATSVNTEMGATLNPQGGVAIVGSCSQAGSTDPAQTVGCMISYPGSQVSGQPLAIIFSQVFGQGYMPGGSSAAWAAVVYDSQGTAYLGGSGTDGRVDCGGSTPCSTAVIAKFPPPAGS